MTAGITQFCATVIGLLGLLLLIFDCDDEYSIFDMFKRLHYLFSVITSIILLFYI